MLIPLALAISVGISSLSIIQKQINNTREINFNNVNKEIRNVFSSAASLVNKISVDETVMNYAKQTSRDYWVEYKIKRYIENSMSLHNDIEACFIYFPQHNYVISNSAGFKSSSFCNRYYNIEYEKWLRYLDFRENGIKLVNITNDKSILYDADSYIWLIKKISLYHKTSQPVIAVVQINKKTLIRKIRQMSIAADDEFFIHDGKKILMSTLKRDDVLPIFRGIINGQYQDGEKLNFNDKSYQISSENLSLFGLTSVHVFIDLDVSQANRAKYFAGFGLFFCIVITIAYCIAFSKKHSEKPKKILSLLEEGISDKIGHKREVTVHNAIDDSNRQVFINEYATIEKLVKEYIKDYAAIAEVYNRQSSKLKELYLEKLLLKGLSDEYDLKEFMKLANNNTLNDGYAITLYVPIDECDISESEDSQKYNAARVSKGILERTYNHLIPEGDSIYIIIMENNHLVCIHNLSIEAVNEQGKTLSEIVEKSVNILNSLQDTEYTVFVSNVYKSAYNLKDAYDEVMEKFSAKKREKSNEKETDGKPYWINSCIEIIEKNYINWELTTSFIAEQLGLTRSYLSSSFAKYMGIGLHEYIQKYRISKAKSILTSNPDIRIADLASEIGLDNVTSFIRLFKKIEGVTPGIFRDQIKEKAKEI